MIGSFFSSLSTLACPLPLAQADPLLGYVGPAGIGALGILLVVVLVLFIGLFGLVFYPIRLLLARRRRLRQEQSEVARNAVEPSTIPERS